MSTIWRVTARDIQPVEGIRRTNHYVWVRLRDGGAIFKCRIKSKDEGYYFTFDDAVEALKQSYTSQYADLSAKLDSISQSAKFLGLNLPPEAPRSPVKAYKITPGSPVTPLSFAAPCSPSEGEVINLSKCQPGQRVMSKDGSVYRFLYTKGSNMLITHEYFVYNPESGVQHSYTLDGVWSSTFSSSSRDIVHIFPYTIKDQEYQMAREIKRIWG